VGDDLNRVQVFDSTGTYQSSIGSDGDGDGQFFGIGGIALAPDGSLYMTDNLNKRVEKFTSSGTFVVAWGAAGSGAGQFDSPRGLDTDATGNIYVADTNNDRIQKFGYGTTAEPLTWGQLKHRFRSQ
jgi:DNA-binding beta-propeller fold protein YncE